MTGGGRPSPGPVPAAGLGELLGVSPQDAGLLAEFCSPVLEAAGIEPRRFFEVIENGGPLSEALGLPSGLTDILYASAHRWFAVERPDRAEPLFRALCLADGTVADHWAGLGICLRARGGVEEARLAFAVASCLEPQWAAGHFHAAELEIFAGNLPEARERLVRFFDTRDQDTPQPMIDDARRMLHAIERRASPQSAQEPGR